MPLRFTSLGRVATARLVLLALLLAGLPVGFAEQDEELPEVIKPYTEIADGLEGLEMSLTNLLAINLGCTLHAEALGEDNAERTAHHRDNWNQQVGEFAKSLAPKAKGKKTLYGGVIYLDTGWRTDPETGVITIEEETDLRLVVSRDYAELFERRQLIAGMCVPGLSRKDARKLEVLLEKECGKADDVGNPWIRESFSFLDLMKSGKWEKRAAELEQNGTFEGTLEELLTKIREQLGEALLDPLRPRLPEEVLEGRNFRFEGDVVIQVLSPKDEAWEPPPALVAANASDHLPTMLIQVPTLKRYGPEVEMERIRIGMVVGGGHRTLHDGAWPIP